MHFFSESFLFGGMIYSKRERERDANRDLLAILLFLFAPLYSSNIVEEVPYRI